MRSYSAHLYPIYQSVIGSIPKTNDGLRQIQAPILSNLTTQRINFAVRLQAADFRKSRPTIIIIKQREYQQATPFKRPSTSFQISRFAIHIPTTNCKHASSSCGVGAPMLLPPIYLPAHPIAICQALNTPGNAPPPYIHGTSPGNSSPTIRQDALLSPPLPYQSNIPLTYAGHKMWASRIPSWLCWRKTYYHLPWVWYIGTVRRIWGYFWFFT